MPDILPVDLSFLDKIVNWKIQHKIKLMESLRIERAFIELCEKKILSFKN